MLSSNTKLLGKAVHCLAKVGREAIIEWSSDTLTLKTFNSVNSVQETFNFQQSFFSAVENTNDRSMRKGKCIVNVKSLHYVFESLIILKKSVKSCSLELDDSSILVVTMSCRHSVTKHEMLVTKVVYPNENQSPSGDCKIGSAKRKSFFFKGCFKAIFYPHSDSDSTVRILAPDSDED